MRPDLDRVRRKYTGRAGAGSLLERNYLVRVERAHRLPRGARQVRAETAQGVVYRDVRYDAQQLVVELDGRIGHFLVADRWRDVERDLLGALDGDLTIRLGWAHVETQPCVVAARLGMLLQRRGWNGKPRTCGRGCAVD